MASILHSVSFFCIGLVLFVAFPHIPIATADNDCISSPVNCDDERRRLQVKSQIYAYHPTLFDIYRRYLKIDPELSGKLVFEMVVTEGGYVASIELEKSEFQLPEFVEEVKQHIQQARFNGYDKTLRVFYSLSFSRDALNEMEAPQDSPFDRYSQSPDQIEAVAPPNEEPLAEEEWAEFQEY